MPGQRGDHPVTRLLRFVDPNDFRKDGCWLWTGHVEGNGYGKFNIKGRKQVWVHRAAYMLFCGPIPDGHEVCHSCDIRACIRPDHLFIGTQLDNMQDAYQKDRLSRGRKHAFSIHRGLIRSSQVKITPEQVVIIDQRLKSGHKPSAIAADFKITAGNVRLIKNGRIWSHITKRHDPKEGVRYAKQV